MVFRKQFIFFYTFVSIQITCLNWSCMDSIIGKKSNLECPYSYSYDIRIYRSNKLLKCKQSQANAETSQCSRQTTNLYDLLWRFFKMCLVSINKKYNTHYFQNFILSVALKLCLIILLWKISFPKEYELIPFFIDEYESINMWCNQEKNEVYIIF